MQVTSFGFSDSGQSKSHNEDSYLCNDKEFLYLVADGVGGQVFGEQASRLAVSCVEKYIIESRAKGTDQPLKSRKGYTPEQQRLLAAVTYANKKIHEMGRKNPAMQGMGTTLSGVTVEGSHLAGVNIGDTRLYRIRKSRINRLTHDHTLAGQQEREGFLSREEARTHPQRHILTSVLGGYNEKPRIDVYLAEIEENDLFLLCTDGLYSMLEDGQLMNIIASVKDRSLYKIGLSLVLSANLAGGKDNITVVLMDFQKNGVMITCHS